MSSQAGPPPFVEELRRLLATAVRRAGGGPALVCAAAPAPKIDPFAVFRRAAGRERALWVQAGEAFALVAVGAAARLAGQGGERFAQVAAAWRRLLARAAVEQGEGCPLPPPVLIGGFAFDPDRERGPEWSDYPDALLVVPRVLFLRQGEGWWVIVSAPTGGGRAGGEADWDAPAREAARLALGEEPPPSEDRRAPGVALREEGNGERWQEAVSALLADIRRGAVQKVVLARRVRTCAAGPIDPAALARRLAAGFPGCTVFAFARGDTCFLGATPERLVRLRGSRLRADPLAGSTARGATEAEDQALGQALLSDEKERREHALVVEALREALAPLCSHLRVPQGPSLLRTPTVQHLHTPIEGVLREHRPILGLVERLHPTPAAGGLPQREALRLIRRHEPFDRGWYAGPVGWMDGRGDGEFAVAIRSALLRGEEALLYAGCGIVAGSDPEREYQESCLKLRPMLSALNAGLARRPAAPARLETREGRP